VAEENTIRFARITGHFSSPASDGVFDDFSVATESRGVPAAAGATTARWTTDFRFGIAGLNVEFGMRITMVSLGLSFCCPIYRHNR